MVVNGTMAAKPSLRVVRHGMVRHWMVGSDVGWMVAVVAGTVMAGAAMARAGAATVVARAARRVAATLRTQIRLPVPVVVALRRALEVHLQSPSRARVR